MTVGSSAPRPRKLSIADFWLRARVYSCFSTVNFFATKILPDIGVARGESKGPPPPNCNASNDKFVRKKVIVASDFFVGLLSDHETFFFFRSSPNFCVKIGPTLREDLFCFCTCLGLHCVPPPPPNPKLNSNYISGPPLIKSPKSDSEDFDFCGLPPPQSKFLATRMLPDATF